ncbi:adenylate cyclase associated N terminal-domain-containing protein [Myxozyma melibiosi]|uniref:Adenylyl cyclase-associated protein n=1 Tax=Myxozyma melibiosi TaxID=54550 RepID=A0ABR1F7F6_9ASCO
MAEFPNIPGYNLVTLMKRLEAATSRLEDLTVFQSQSIQSSREPSAISTRELPSALATSSATPVAAATPAAPAEPTPAPAPEPVVEQISPAVQEFDDYVAEFVTPFVALSKEIDPVVAEQAEAVASAFAAEREFLLIVSKAKKPAASDSAFMDLFKPISEQVVRVQDLREGNRRSKFFNHLSTVSEGIPAIGWIGVEPTPVPFVGEMKDSAQFYANRVIKEYKEIDKKHVEWAQGYLKLLTNLQAFVKKNHTTGPSWNPKGEDLATVLASSKSKEAAAPTPAAPPAPAAGGPPPPPPPPPSSVFQVSSEPSAPAGGIGAVFAEINKGSSVTSGLKKVDKSQMTHKNPSLRAKEPVAPTTKSKTPPPPTKPQSLKQKKPPRMELEGTKWIIENYENNPEVIVEVEINHGVFIHRCANSTIQLKGKFNALTINECKSTGILIESMVSGVDVIKSTSFGLQVTGKLPTISIDQCDGGQIYLSDQSLDVEIYTSKSSAININVPDPELDGDFKEQPVPEQLVHSIKDGKLVSTIVEHMG